MVWRSGSELNSYAVGSEAVALAFFYKTVEKNTNLRMLEALTTEVDESDNIETDESCKKYEITREDLKNYADPEHWPGLCTNGKKQSPIDIVRENTVKKDLRPLEFLKYGHAATGVVANNGHTVEIRFSEDTFLLEGGELPATYVLDHIHFHWPSEHTVNGVHDAFEAHFVHYNNKYADLKAASQQEAGIAVVSTLLSR
ncbi:carbonic anhydrase 2-like [Lasioglossum baleicum]|uniref:carbonic anhydrase 2-like n=1 Tax=Lasioglossum baleicum TaxID=434251 RepID=UPI003FCE06BB